MDPAQVSTTSRRRRVLAPALTLLITAAVVAGAGVAGAADPATVYVTESGQCYRFTETAGTPCTDGERADVTIETGEVVTWDFNTGSSMHNVVSTNEVPADPAWTNWSVDFSSSGTYQRQFMHPGTYEFVCQVHTGMAGTVTVIEGDGTATPIPTQTATPTPTPTATATPAPTVQATTSTSTDDHTQTPAPGHGAKDKVAPKVQTMRLRARARELSIRFWLSEPATVRITTKRRGSKGTLASATVQSPAGTRTVKLRSKRFKRGTYTVSLRATDAMGNKATAARKNVRLRSSR
jgi:plastocyanin